MILGIGRHFCSSLLHRSKLTSTTLSEHYGQGINIRHEMDRTDREASNYSILVFQANGSDRLIAKQSITMAQKTLMIQYNTEMIHTCGQLFSVSHLNLVTWL
jgi:hypothetical protein